MMIQKSVCLDSFIPISNSTDLLRRLFRQHRPKGDMRYQEQSPATAAYEAGLGRAATRSKVESDEIEGVGALIHPQPGEFDHLSPLRRLACDVPSEIGRRACEDHRAQVDDPLLDRRIGKGC